jgi:ABC-type branched-subunit amino acid transport system substrate-binding protein
MTRRLAVATVIASAAVLPLVSGPAASAAPAALPPLVVATESPVGTPFGKVPQIFAGVKAAARAINRAGGIAGHRVEVDTCNGQANASTELRCATDAVQAGAVAMVGNFVSLSGAAVDAALLSGQTADLAAIAPAPAQYNGTNVFPLAFPVAEGTVCTTSALSKLLEERTRVASVAVSIPGGLNQAGVVSTSAGKQGGSRVEGVGTVKVGLTTVDFAPVVAQTAALNANVVFTVVAPPQILGFISASSAAGKTWAYCANDGGLTASALLQLGSAVPNAFLGSPYPPLSAASQYPILKKFMAQMRAEQAAGDSAASLTSTGYSSNALNAWLGMQVFAQVASSIKGPIDHTTFLSKLGTAKVNLQVIPPINFAKPIGSGAYPRVFNAKQYLLSWSLKKKDLLLVPRGTGNNSFAIFGLGS